MSSNPNLMEQKENANADCLQRLVRQQLVESIKSEIKNIGCIYRSVGNALYDEPINRLAERISENLGRDSERLNWLQNADGRIGKFGDGWNAWVKGKTSAPHIVNDDIRKAIDAAMLPNIPS